MKKRMNKVQGDYILARAMWEAVNQVQKQKFYDFLSTKGLTENDVDDDNFETLNAEYDIFAKAEIEDSAAAWENLKAAETALLEFGISIAPVKIRETLRKGLKMNTMKKLEILETLMKLDITTIPAAFRS
jgi:hypothetical protein